MGWCRGGSVPAPASRKAEGVVREALNDLEQSGILTQGPGALLRRI
ncbi:MAG TPA: hypothetical protein VK997_03795 [Deferrisomatales bacterium]|nr:hypothetical protein [Deferrisomatales bacterium]